MIFIQNKGLNIEEIKRKITKLLGKKITLTIQRSYNSNRVINVKLVSVYQHFFIVQSGKIKEGYKYSNIEKIKIEQKELLIK